MKLEYFKPYYEIWLSGCIFTSYIQNSSIVRNYNFYNSYIIYSNFTNVNNSTPDELKGISLEHVEQLLVD